jgi:5'-AMP-activated protein kinase catalytic alpha subunit
VWFAEQADVASLAAIKAIEKSKIPSGSPETRFIREINLLQQMDHPFIIKTMEVFDDDIHHYIVMEYAGSGNLRDYIEMNGPLTEDRARCYFVQLISALEYLHTTSFVPHRDLKLENILLDRFNIIKLIDFGLESNVKGSDFALPVDPCMAPEVVSRKKYSYSSDVWSAGIILYFMVTGTFPFEGDTREKLFQSITGSESVFDRALSPSLIDLLRKLLQNEPRERITLPRVREHPWFSLTLHKALRPVLSKTLDVEILQRLTKIGHSARLLSAIIVRDENSEPAVLYRFLKREKESQKINELLRGLRETSARLGHRYTTDDAGTTVFIAPRDQTQVRSSRTAGFHPRLAQPHRVLHAVTSVVPASTRHGFRGMLSGRAVTARPRTVRETSSGRLFES